VRGTAGVWARRGTLLAVSGLLLAGNLAFFLWYRSTMRQRQEALEGRRAALAKDVEATEAEAARLSRQRGHLLQVSEALDEFYGQRVGPPRETLAPRIDELHAILRRVGVSPTDIRYTSGAVKDLPLSEMKISFGFHNDYDQFKKLLAAFESSKQWIAVRQVTLSRDQEAAGSVLVRMELSTYFLEQEKPLVRTAATTTPGRSRS
jgi:Tfp pilus assembly protein PilO